MQREQHLLLRSMDECSVVAMECTPDRDLLLFQIPVAKMKRSIEVLELFDHTVFSEPVEIFQFSPEQSSML